MHIPDKPLYRKGQILTQRRRGAKRLSNPITKDAAISAAPASVRAAANFTGITKVRYYKTEGSYEHVATKADIANLKADIERAKWQIILAVGGIVGLITLIERWLG